MTHAVKGVTVMPLRILSAIFGLVRSWRARLSLFAAAVLILGGCLAIRYFWGAGSASAQQPGGRVAPATYEKPSANKQAQPKRPTTAENRALARKIKVMAVVNGEQITRDELAQEALRRYGESVLSRVLNKELILQECRRRKITITKAEIDGEVRRIAGKFGLSTDRWLTMLSRERGVTPAQYQRDIIWPTLALRKLAAENLQVDSQKVERAYLAQYGPAVQVRMISVTDQAKANKLYQMAVDRPDSFGDLAKEHSEDKASASLRGRIPPIRRYAGNAEIEDVVFSLKAGQISQPVYVAKQYFLFQCINHFPARKVDAALKKKIYAQLEDRIRDEQLRTASSDLFRRLQKEAKVVNVYNDPKLRQQYPGVAARINGHNFTIRDLAEECILRHGREVLSGEIHRRLVTQALARKKLRVTQDAIDAEVRRAARSYGFEKEGKIDIEAWLQMITEQQDMSVELYLRDVVWPTVALKTLVGDQVEVTEEDLKRGFEANYGPRVEALAIVLNDHRRDQYSIEPVSRENHGKIPPIQKWGGQPLIEKEAFRLKPGELSQIVAMGNKFIILKCLGHTEPIVTQMKDVRHILIDDIKEKKLRLMMAQEFDRIKDNAHIDNILAGTTHAGKARVARKKDGPGLPGQGPNR